MSEGYEVPTELPGSTGVYVPVVLLLLLPIFLSLFLSVSLFRGTSNNNIAISVPALLFFRSYNEVFVQTAFIAYFPSGKYYFSM